MPQPNRRDPSGRPQAGQLCIPASGGEGLFGGAPGDGGGDGRDPRHVAGRARVPPPGGRPGRGASRGRPRQAPLGWLSARARSGCARGAGVSERGDGLDGGGAGLLGLPPSGGGAQPQQQDARHLRVGPGGVGHGGRGRAPRGGAGLRAHGARGERHVQTRVRRGRAPADSRRRGQTGGDSHRRSAPGGGGGGTPPAHAGG
mmetsp:Transcript_4654/g.15397  ORF Transcript_4654/g.15397 Transcript_4654/m.15397 type:complete len:201 (+) Transcript_4654:4215-4817(+)